MVTKQVEDNTVQNHQSRMTNTSSQLMILSMISFS